MNFDAAQGWLVGEPNAGLPHMFTMMNYERLSMGLQGNGLAEASYQTACAYAQERLQGRAASVALRQEKAADPIIVHPDVRRMLLTIRANTLAGRALSMYAALQLDTVRFHADKEKRQHAENLVSLLIPVQKAYCSDRGFDSCVLAQQVLGGHGYVAEWGLEQNVRDARIAQIYEGANGIQALDLMGRKTVRCEGELLAALIADIDSFIAEHAENPDMQDYLPHLEQSKQSILAATNTVLAANAKDPDAVGAASYPYMELMGLTLYCFMWLRILAAATQGRRSGSGNNVHLGGIIKTGEFFLARILPGQAALRSEIEAGAGALMALSEEEFGVAAS